MPKQKSKRKRPVPKSKSSLDGALFEPAKPNVPTFTEIGGSPLPGFTLRHVLRGHTDWIGRIAWSPDGAYLASPSADNTIRIWDWRSGTCLRTLQGSLARKWKSHNQIF